VLSPPLSPLINTREERGAREEEKKGGVRL